MKRWKWFGLIAVVCAIPLVVLAVPPGGKGPGGERKGPGPGKRQQNRGDMFLNRFDTNEDGQVSEGEWTDAFRALDANKDGVVTKEELEQHRAKVREERFQAHFKELDTDGDGSLSIKEFPGRDRAFKKIDADANGLISPEELKAAQEQMRQRMEKRQQRRVEGERGRRGGRGRWGGEAED